MSPELWFENIAFYLVALVTLGSAVGVVLARKVIHAACFLLPWPASLPCSPCSVGTC